ncbi:MAG: hypothetical protein ACE5H1_01195 [Thermodesulfobacteriota bacterium]
MVWQIISDGVAIGNFQSKEEAQAALVKYVKNGYVKESKPY